MSCTIFLEHNGYFYPGSYINGRVICHFNDKKNIRGIKLTLKGKEHTEWTNNSGKSRITYEGNNVFLEQEIILHGDVSIGPGRFEYPFILNLPNTCPGTFILKSSYIEYSVKAVVDIPNLPDYEDKRTFPVVAPIDFNTQNINMNPIHLQADKTLLCLWCVSGPITLNLYLDKQAYILGEPIKFKLRCSNLSKENIMSFSVTLTKVIKLTTTESLRSSSTKKNKQLLASMDVLGVEAHGEIDYDLAIFIPHDVCLPNFNMCKLFHLICKFQVTAELPTLYRNFGVETMLTLGNISPNRQPGDVTVPYPSPPSYSQNTVYNPNSMTTVPTEGGKSLIPKGLGFNRMKKKSE